MTTSPMTLPDWFSRNTLSMAPSSTFTPVASSPYLAAKALAVSTTLPVWS